MTIPRRSPAVYFIPPPFRFRGESTWLEESGGLSSVRRKADPRLETTGIGDNGREKSSERGGGWLVEVPWEPKDGLVELFRRETKAGRVAEE